MMWLYLRWHNLLFSGFLTPTFCSGVHQHDAPGMQEHDEVVLQQHTRLRVLPNVWSFWTAETVYLHTDPLLYRHYIHLDNFNCIPSHYHIICHLQHMQIISWVFPGIQFLPLDDHMQTYAIFCIYLLQTKETAVACDLLPYFGNGD